MWLHSSVGRASHRYRGGHVFESRWSLEFFRLLLSNCFKLENLLRWSFFTFIYNRSSNIWIISYILHINVAVCCVGMLRSFGRGFMLTECRGKLFLDFVRLSIGQTEHFTTEVTYLPSKDFELDFELDFRVRIFWRDVFGGCFWWGFQ